jgi:transitional endoplasmic reticulum ATPase
MRKCPTVSEIDYQLLAKSTNGYVGADLVSLCRESNYLALQRSFQGRDEHLVTLEDFKQSMQKLGSPSLLRSNTILVENTTWDDIGGLDEVKSKLKRLIEWPLLHKEHFKRLGLKPTRGILLYGPPGCSKTTLVKVAFYNNY